MTEKEAIENIKAYICKCNYTWTVKSIFNEYVKHLNGAYVSYTALDVIENCHRSLKRLSIKALEEIQQYRAIGTVEECREAVEKQKAKELVYESDSVFSNGFSHYRMGKCPMCDRYYNSSDEVNYCSKCGQAIQWDENLEGMGDD